MSILIFISAVVIFFLYIYLSPPLCDSYLYENLFLAVHPILIRARDSRQNKPSLLGAGLILIFITSRTHSAVAAMLIHGNSPLCAFSSHTSERKAALDEKSVLLPGNDADGKLARRIHHRVAMLLILQYLIRVHSPVQRELRHKFVAHKREASESPRYWKQCVVIIYCVHVVLLSRTLSCTERSGDEHQTALVRGQSQWRSIG